MFDKRSWLTQQEAESGVLRQSASFSCGRAITNALVWPCFSPPLSCNLNVAKLVIFFIYLAYTRHQVSQVA